jgi:GntR family transcriptional repressor for pyruvate dehydrogenase complex
VAERLREYIDGQHLEAGDRLPGELDLVQQLQVSRPILREAISRLESLGLVAVQRGRGTFVADRDHLGSCVRFLQSALAIGPKDLVPFAELRTVIECFAARRAAERATPQDVAELADLCERMDQEDLDYLDAVRIDFQFHRKIVEMSGNVLLPNLIEVIHEYILAGMVKTTPKPRDRSWSRPLHAAILRAIQAGDGAAAEKAMQRHMAAVVLRLTAAVEAEEAPPARKRRRR